MPPDKFSSQTAQQKLLFAPNGDTYRNLQLSIIQRETDHEEPGPNRQIAVTELLPAPKDQENNGRGSERLQEPEDQEIFWEILSPRNYTHETSRVYLPKTRPEQ